MDEKTIKCPRCGALLNGNARRCLACGELSGTSEPPREAAGIRAITSGLAKRPNLNLAAISIVLPVTVCAIILAFETVSIHATGRIPEPAGMWLVWFLIIAEFAPFIIIPFACWRAFRDYRRRSRQQFPSGGGTAAP
jgi:hypothetical protein